VLRRIRTRAEELYDNRRTRAEELYDNRRTRAEELYENKSKSFNCPFRDIIFIAQNIYPSPSVPLGTGQC